GGFPGVYSRYVFDTIGNRGILRLLEDVEDRRARFEAVIGYKPDAAGDSDIKLFKGVVEGYVSLSPRGEGGFGYDPIFIPEGYGKTFAEDKALKSRLSHRRKVAEKFIGYLKRGR
ncbi:MAG: non-canonical purine NTP pyrophosphatase, partial [Methanobacteriota archaeon]